MTAPVRSCHTCRHLIGDCCAISAPASAGVGFPWAVLEVRCEEWAPIGGAVLLGEARVYLRPEGGKP